MPRTAEKFATIDPVWSGIREEALKMALSEPALASFLHATVLNHERFEGALSFHLAQKLGNSAVSAMLVRQVFDEALGADPDIGAAVRADIVAVYDRDTKRTLGCFSWRNTDFGTEVVWHPYRHAKALA